MQSKQNRTTYHTSYVTSGNLAPVPSNAPVFTVIEGGASKSASQARDRVEERRVQRQAVERRMHVRYFAAFVLVVIAIIGASLLSDSLFSQAYGRAFADVETTSVTVAAGDSLWEIAEAHPVSGRSVRDVMRWIENTNDLSNATLFVGQELIVPIS